MALYTLQYARYRSQVARLFLGTNFRFLDLSSWWGARCNDVK